ncbi:MAG: ferrous iron transporter B, partial [Clostridia bacterium]|nr:ferrous iron transporter B [Clostridia bacterium]
YAGRAVAWIFAPIGFGTWQATVASITGLIAKENIVGTMGIIYRTAGRTVYSVLKEAFTPLAGFSFLVFNLLCAPCFAAIGAIKREMNSGKWTWFAILYQCGFAYAVSLMIYQIGGIFAGTFNVIGLIAALLVLGAMIYMLFIRKYKEAETLEGKVVVASKKERKSRK